MTLDANKPTDQTAVSDLPSYIREDREAINAVAGSGNVGVTDLTVPLAATSLSVGTDLGSYGFESVICTGTGVSTLLTILGGTDGQVKVFAFQDTNVRLTDSISKAGGTFYLNQLPAASNFNPQIDDVLALVNVGGDGASVHGYWKELYRTLSLK